MIDILVQFFRGARGRSSRPTRWATLALPALFAILACGDDPFEIRWNANPDTALIYSLARPELDLPSAYSFNPRRSVRVESPGSTGTWDIALDTEGTDLVLLPPGALGINSRARIAALPGMDFDDVREAPSDTLAYVTDEGVRLELGTIYVVQTRQTSGQFGSLCSFFAKLEPIALGIEDGTFEFLYDTNPVCNDRRLVPPED